jgi:hypothetical protein
LPKQLRFRAQSEKVRAMKFRKSSQVRLNSAEMFGFPNFNRNQTQKALSHHNHRFFLPAQSQLSPTRLFFWVCRSVVHHVTVHTCCFLSIPSPCACARLCLSCPAHRCSTNFYFYDSFVFEQQRQPRSISLSPFSSARYHASCLAVNIAPRNKASAPPGPSESRHT